MGLLDWLKEIFKPKEKKEEPKYVPPEKIQESIEAAGKKAKEDAAKLEEKPAVPSISKSSPPPPPATTTIGEKEKQRLEEEKKILEGRRQWIGETVHKTAEVVDVKIISTPVTVPSQTQATAQVIDVKKEVKPVLKVETLQKQAAQFTPSEREAISFMGGAAIGYVGALVPPVGMAATAASMASLGMTAATKGIEGVKETLMAPETQAGVMGAVMGGALAIPKLYKTIPPPKNVLVEFELGKEKIFIDVKKLEIEKGISKSAEMSRKEILVSKDVKAFAFLEPEVAERIQLEFAKQPGEIKTIFSTVSTNKFEYSKSLFGARGVVLSADVYKKYIYDPLTLTQEIAREQFLPLSVRTRILPGETVSMLRPASFSGITGSIFLSGMGKEKIVEKESLVSSEIPKEILRGVQKEKFGKISDQIETYKPVQNEIEIPVQKEIFVQKEMEKIKSPQIQIPREKIKSPPREKIKLPPPHVSSIPNVPLSFPTVKLKFNPYKREKGKYREMAFYKPSVYAMHFKLPKMNKISTHIFRPEIKIPKIKIKW